MKKLLNISDLNKKDIFTIFDNADSLSKDILLKPLSNKSIGLIFEKYSTRTRLSFQVGILKLGGNTIDIKFEDLNMQRIESFEDTFKILSLYLDGLVFRTDDHKKLINAQNYFDKPIINGLSNISHPCQIISDIYTLKNIFKDFENLKICWFGDMNNVLFSYCEFLQIFTNIKLNVFTDKKIYSANVNNFPKVQNINYHFDLEKNIINQADCIMTDVYTSMNDNENNEKEFLLKKFQINSELMSLTSDKCVFAHCLPANLGSEVTNEVINSKKSIVLKQAENRMVAQNGILKWLF